MNDTPLNPITAAKLAASMNRENDSTSTYCEACGCRIARGQCQHGVSAPAPIIPSAAQTTAALASLANFIGPVQRRILAQNASRGEERDFFRSMICDLAGKVASMPKTYETDGQGYRATAHLHYFAGGQANWYVTERDIDTDSEGQLQAFGHADLFGDGGELGYICIAEIIEAGGELDLYWTPKTLGAITGKPEVDEAEQEAIEAFNATA